MRKKADEASRLCEFCRFAAEIHTTDDMLCEYRGVVNREYSGRKFVYDPLKRVPRKLPEVVVPEDLEAE